MDPGHSSLSDFALHHTFSFTDMVPRAEIGHSISALIVGGKFEMGTMETSKMLPDSWGSVIQEMVLNTNIIRNGLSKGQEDFKFVVYGNRASGPLSLVYNVKETGHVSDYMKVLNVSVMDIYIHACICSLSYVKRMVCGVRCLLGGET